MSKTNERKFDPSRRALFKVGAAAAAGAVVTSLALAPRSAHAAKASKAVAMYQATPHGNQFCANCIHFIPGKTPQADGTCQVVDSSISPHGWCVLYAPKA
ncbi:MAG: high-potential iron-sulfur protein [Alphaproteobacteria bacterium]|nr:high-potential iron-sulfur protein [Alphaproteobacteria bacterium]